MRLFRAFSLNISALKVAVPYFIIASIWIYFSDRVVNNVIEDTGSYHTYKGLIFVLATSVLLYIMVSRTTRRLRLSNERIRRLLQKEKSLHSKTEQASHQLKETVEEKEFLLRELHHRVKNNLAVVAGLIDLQTEQISSADAVIPLKSTQSRIHTIANIHKLLHKEQDLKNISLFNLLKDLSETTAKILVPSKAAFRFDVEDLLINVNQAMPLGLLLNEIFSSLSNHPEGKELEIAFTTDQTNLPEVTLLIEIAPLSRSLASDFNSEDESFRATLVSLLLQQFGAEM